VTSLGAHSYHKEGEMDVHTEACCYKASKSRDFRKGCDEMEAALTVLIWVIVSSMVIGTVVSLIVLAITLLSDR